MKLRKIDKELTVCKLESFDSVDFGNEFMFLSKTDDEISLVCESNKIPSNAIATETGWKALKICGILDFGMIGVISRITSILAEAQICVFVISTYNTDYILIKSKDFDRGVQELAGNGYDLSETQWF